MRAALRRPGRKPAIFSAVLVLVALVYVAVSLGATRSVRKMQQQQQDEKPAAAEMAPTPRPNIVVPEKDADADDEGAIKQAEAEAEAAAAQRQPPQQQQRTAVNEEDDEDEALETLTAAHPRTPVPLQAAAGATDAAADFERREELYRRNVEQQRRFRDSVSLAQYRASNTMWYLYEPAFPCPFPERIGEMGDHAKWLCNVDDTVPQDETCVSLNFGLGDDVVFERELRKRRPNCEMHGFDPTPAMKGLMEQSAKTIGMTYHELALCGKPSSTVVIAPFTQHWKVPCKTLPEIVADLGKDHIDVLKIDIEGFEFDAVDAAWNGPQGCAGMVPVGQIEMEIHHLWLREEHRDPPKEFIKLMSTMERCGFRLFSKEPNLFPGNTDAIEVSWIHESRFGMAHANIQNKDDDDT